MRCPTEPAPAWLVPFLLASLAASAVAYTLAPDAGVAPVIKPLPALSAAALVWLGARPGRTWLASALVLAAVGDVLLDFDATLRLGTLLFAVVVAVMARGLWPAVAGPAWRGVVVAGSWTLVSGVAVVPSLGDRLVAGTLILVATAVMLYVAGRGSALLAVGGLLIASNFTLFAVDLVLTPMPRWLVIGVYYVGLLLVAVHRGVAARPPATDPTDTAVPTTEAR